MELLSEILTKYIFDKGIIIQEDKEIYKYGFLCFLEISLSTITCILISVLFHMLWECCFFFIVFIPLRSYCGGLHFSKYIYCYIASVSLLICILFLSKCLFISPNILLIFSLLSSVLLFFQVPITHPNRQLSKVEYSILKRKSHIVLILFSTLSVVLYLIDIKVYFSIISLIFCFMEICALCFFTIHWFRMRNIHK